MSDCNRFSTPIDTTQQLSKTTANDSLVQTAMYQQIIRPLMYLHQQRITRHQIQRLCVLTHVTFYLRPLRPVRPELPGKVRSTSTHLEPDQYTTFRPDLLVKATLPPVHPDSSINTIAHHDLPLRDARFRGTTEDFLA